MSNKNKDNNIWKVIKAIIMVILGIIIIGYLFLMFTR